MTLENIFVFSIQDNACGGLIFADSIDDAYKKLSKQRGVAASEMWAVVYPLSNIELDDDDYGVFDLW